MRGSVGRRKVEVERVLGRECGFETITLKGAGVVEDGRGRVKTYSLVVGYKSTPSNLL